MVRPSRRDPQPDRSRPRAPAAARRLARRRRWPLPARRRTRPIRRRGRAAPAPSAQPPGGGTLHVVTSQRAGRAWIGPLIAVVVLALILIFLLIPGVLLYPSQPIAEAGLGLNEDLALRRDINETLRERLDALRGAVAENVCRADGELVLPDGRRPDGLPPGAAGEAAGPEGAPGPSPQALLPPDPQQLVPPPDPAAPSQPFTGSLVDLLDQATVLVVVAAENGGIGSGFFVAPQIVVTNRHVIEGAGADQVFVTNQTLGGLQPARILHRTTSSDIGSPDYAVLEVPTAGDLPQLALASRVQRLDNVVAGGYPGVILETDVSFQALRGGDPTAIPQMAVTQGVVTVIQQAGPDLPIIIHTANIAPGNSGGPLIDSCGRVVGVNTFIRVDGETSSRLNYALQAERAGRLPRRAQRSAHLARRRLPAAGRSGGAAGRTGDPPGRTGGPGPWRGRAGDPAGLTARGRRARRPARSRAPGRRGCDPLSGRRAPAGPAG